MEATGWKIDTARSSIGFSVRHMLFAKVRGCFRTWSAAIALDDEDLTRSSVTAEIDAGSIDTGAADRDAALRTADFLDTAQFPKLGFKSHKVEALGRDRYRLTGALTIRDVTREITLDVTQKDPQGHPRATFSAKTAIDRKDFGLQWNQVLEAGSILVGERIDIELEVQAVRHGPS